jgi:hypothetical protein
VQFKIELNKPRKNHYEYTAERDYVQKSSSFEMPTQIRVFKPGHQIGSLDIRTKHCDHFEAHVH